jgi:hypothetical protein
MTKLSNQDHLKKEGEESHTRMSGMHVCMFHVYPQLAYAS